MSIAIPDYRDQSAAVQARMAAIRSRPEILRVQALDKGFAGPKGTSLPVLSAIDFSVHKREFLTIIGASGCGKSTLLRIIAGLEDHSGGSVQVDGRLVTGPGPDRGMVFQAYSLFPWLTVLRNVAFGIAQNGVAGSMAEAEAKTWVNLVGLTGFEDHFPSQLSGGMRQRVAIARALAAKPKLLLMDEPFGALDAQTRGRMQSYLLEIWKNVDITVLFVTHDLDEAILLADRILVLQPNPGRIAELIENPVPHPRRASQNLDPEFLAVKRRLEELIHPETPDSSGSDFRMLKLTPAGEEIV